jgi:Cd2+/Zn2+-exporting ATPase
MHTSATVNKKVNKSAGITWDKNTIEAVFVPITLVAMIAGWFLENQAGHLTWQSWVAFGVAYFTGGLFGLIGGFQGLVEHKIDIDLLMVLAAAGAAAIGAPFEGALLLFLFSLSNVMQTYAMQRTRNAIAALLKLRPDQAVVKRMGKWVPVPLADVRLDEVFVLKPGDRVPLDGVVLIGSSSLNQASLTGESMPVTKQVGDQVLAGSINGEGHLEVRVAKLAQDSTLAKMIYLVEEAQAAKANTQYWLERAEQYYATGVIIATALLIAVPVIFVWEAFTPAFYRGMTVLVAASPCALVISTPAAILSAIANGARRGILFKGGQSVESAANVKAITFDKTGTLTVGKPSLTDTVLLAPDLISAGDLLQLTASLEIKSQHPLAHAIVEAAQQQNIELLDAQDFQAVTGKGLSGSVAGRQLIVGKLPFLATLGCANQAAAEEAALRLQNQGKTTVGVADVTDSTKPIILGLLAIADQVRPTALQTVRELQRLGIKVVMLTGDNHIVAKAIAAEVGVDDFYADLLPADKVTQIKALQAKYGVVAMVGDGVNDAPALATADIGLAMGAAGSDVALETADIVLLADDLPKIAYVLGLSRAARRTLYVNLAFAMSMIVLMIVAIFVVAMPLPLAVIGHEGGTVLVVLNGLRLLGYRQPPLA